MPSTSFITLICLFACTIGASAQDTLKAKTTDTVVVNSRARQLDIRADKTIYTPPASSATGKQLLELLQTTPGVVVDPNENIIMSGRQGVLVYIDGRNTQLSGADLASVLKTIPADNVKSIEIIANPGAAFDASGNAGILNIVLKKSMRNGFNGQAGGSYSQAVHARGQANTSLNYRSGKLNVFAQLSAEKGLQHTKASNERQAGNWLFVQNSVEKDAFISHSLRTGADYAISKSNTLGLLFTQSQHQTNMGSEGQTEVLAPGKLPALVATTMQSPFTRRFNNLNLNFATKGKNDFSLNADVDYGRFAYGLDNRLTNVRPGSTDEMMNESRVNISLLTARSDAEFKTGKGRSKAGFKTTFAHSASAVLVQQAQAGRFVSDTGMSNAFDYREQIQALYYSYGRQSKKWQYELGLRAEYSRVRGESEDLKGQRISGPDTSYLNLFPTLQVQYEPKQKHSIQFSAGRRIDRPVYQEQNPFVYVMDAYNREVGNPQLQPQHTWQASAGYTYNWRHSVRLGYSHTSRLKEGLTLQQDSFTYQTPQNAGIRQMVTLSLSSSFSVAKWWSVYAQAEPFFQSFHLQFNGLGTTLQRRVQSIGLNGYIGQQFNLGKGFGAELSGWYNYANRNTQYRTKALGSVSCGVKKQWAHGKYMLRANVNDLFNTQRWSQIAETPNFRMNTYRKWESQNISIGFSIRFGNKYIKENRERSQGNEAEQQRIK